jgi:hypothetical protein
LGTRHERWLALERQNAEQVIELSPEQAAFLEKLNPCFRERHVESERPGQLLSADTFMVGTLKGSAGSTCTPWSTPSARLFARLRAAGGAADRPRHLAAPLQPRAAAPWLPQPGPPPVGNRRAVRQPVTRKTRRLKRHLIASVRYYITLAICDISTMAHYGTQRQSCAHKSTPCSRTLLGALTDGGSAPSRTAPQHLPLGLVDVLKMVVVWACGCRRLLKQWRGACDS